MKYRKKPIEVEAVRVMGKPQVMPGWWIDAATKGVISPGAKGCVFIRSLEGVMRADRGDWVICGIKGELYPVKPDIFAETYEPAE